MPRYSGTVYLEQLSNQKCLSIGLVISTGFLSKSQFRQIQSDPKEVFNVFTSVVQPNSHVVRAFMEFLVEIRQYIVFISHIKQST